MDEILDLKRRLAIEGVHNVRDLGGFTRWERFLRANTMHRPTSADQTALVEYGMRPQAMSVSRKSNYKKGDWHGDGTHQGQLS